MAFIKYDVKTTASTDVRVGKLGITVSNVSLERHHLAAAEFVNLHWDADANEVGISASDSSDKSAFRIKPRGKTERAKFIAAGKFYEHFGLNVEGRNVTDGRLVDRHGVAAFVLHSPQASIPSAPRVGRPRGRRKKEVVQAEQAA